MSGDLCGKHNRESHCSACVLDQELSSLKARNKRLEHIKSMAEGVCTHPKMAAWIYNGFGLENVPRSLLLRIKDLSGALLDFEKIKGNEKK